MVRWYYQMGCGVWGTDAYIDSEFNMGYTIYTGELSREYVKKLLPVKLFGDKMKDIYLAWDNKKPTMKAKDTKSHSRHYVPSGESAFDITYRDTLRIGLLNMQAENMKKVCDEQSFDLRLQQFLDGIPD